MRWRAIFGEAARNLTSGASHAGVALAACVSIATALGVMDAHAVASIAESTNEFERQGGSTYVLTAPGEVDGRVCDRLSSVEGVKASGATFSRGATLEFAQMPGTLVPKLTATPGYTRVLQPNRGDAIPSGLHLAAGLAKTLGVGQGEALTTVEPQMLWTVGGVFENNGRSDQLQYVAVAVSGYGTRYDECWAVVNVAEDPHALLTMAWTPAAAASPIPPRTAQLNGSMGPPSQFREAYANRSTRWTPLLALALGATTGVFITRRRRLEFATALHIGVRRRDLAALGAVESAAVGIAILCGSAFLQLGLVRYAITDADVTLPARALSHSTATALGFVTGSCAQFILARERLAWLYAKWQ